MVDLGSRHMSQSRLQQHCVLFGRPLGALGHGYVGARNDTTQQSGQTPDKEVDIKSITVYVSGYTETDPTGVLSTPTVWPEQSEFVSTRHSGQTPAAVCIGFEHIAMGKNVSNRTC